MDIELTEHQASFLDSLFGQDESSAESFQDELLHVNEYTYNVVDTSFDHEFGTKEEHSIEITSLSVYIKEKSYELIDTKDPIITLTDSQYETLQTYIDRHRNDE